MLYNAELTRQRILAAASALFQFQPIEQVSMDIIAERAGVTKKTLYYHYAGKEQLIVACFERKVMLIIAQYEDWFFGTSSFAEKIHVVLRKMHDFAMTESCHNSAFIRAACEQISQTPGGSLGIIARYKRDHEAMLARLLAAEGYATPDRLARQIAMLVDGCLTTIIMHRDPGYTSDAEAAILALLAAAKRSDAHAGRAPALPVD